MKTLRFKTSMTCSGCVARVTPILNKTFGEKSWEVDVASPEKILTVVSDSASSQEVINALRKVGFTAEAL